MDIDYSPSLVRFERVAAAVKRDPSFKKKLKEDLLYERSILRRAGRQLQYRVKRAGEHGLSAAAIGSAPSYMYGGNTDPKVMAKHMAKHGASAGAIAGTGSLAAGLGYDVGSSVARKLRGRKIGEGPPSLVGYMTGGAAAGLSTAQVQKQLRKHGMPYGHYHVDPKTAAAAGALLSIPAWGYRYVQYRGRMGKLRKRKLKESIISLQEKGNTDRHGNYYVNLMPEQRKRFSGVSVKKDGTGYFVTTHRARSKSYPSVDKIPDSKIQSIERTG